MLCEQNVLDIPVSATMPAPTDLLIFTLPDGTSVLRQWGAILSATGPADVEVYVLATGSDISNGDSVFNISDYVGRRVRFFRNGLKQGLDTNNSSYYSFNVGTGGFTFTPAARTGETFQFESY